MSRMPRLIYLWPGLPQLWHLGLWSGLALAAGFAVLFDLLLLASYVWVELLSPRDLRLGWLAAGTLWGVSAMMSRGIHHAAPNSTTAERLYKQAIHEYLRGNWFEAEALLGRMLRSAPRDVEGRLLLATVLRRSRRYDESSAQLDRLELQRDARLWSREIADERQQIAERIAGAATEPVSLEMLEQPAAQRQAA